MSLSSDNSWVLAWSENISAWNWSTWFWADASVTEDASSTVSYDSILVDLSNTEVRSIAKNVSSNWWRHTYVFRIKYWAKIWVTQKAWTYASSIKNNVTLSY